MSERDRISLDDFEINDIYIDDEMDAHEIANVNIESVQDTGNTSVEQHNDPDLYHYLVAPDGVYLKKQENSDNESDLFQALDPEPSPGPVDPG